MADTTRFAMFEHWTDVSAMENHRVQPHVAAFAEATKDIIGPDPPRIEEFQPCNPE